MYFHLNKLFINTICNLLIFLNSESFILIYFAGFSPSVCSGVVAKVVKAEIPSYYKSLLPGVSQFPAMLETTAAVNPGGSGGAVVNSDGRLIGLVTRYGG